MDIGKLETYKRDFKTHNYAPKTQREYFKYFRDFFRSFLGEIENLTTAEINGYIAEQEASPAKTIIISASIKAFYELCLDRQVRTLKVIRKETQPEILTENEVLKIIASCDSLKLKAIFSTIYYLALRRQEVLKLQVKDISANGFTIRNSKGADRVIFAPPELVHLLREYWKYYRPTSLMFDISEGSLREEFNRILVIAGIGRAATLHTLRHSRATHLYNQGLDIIAIKNLLGHKSLNTTLIYTKFGKPNQQEAVK